ncbi:MAG: hypothetical protein NWE91_01000 [Candidatus Bathyarchaeota archaeon]|nr:hypothetical protein [Candidatus Bathyarchaeota archaeon]
MVKLRKMEATVREYALIDFSQVKELIPKAKNFGDPFLETERLNLEKNTSLGLGKIFVAALKGQVIGHISLGKRALRARERSLSRVHNVFD